MRLPYRTLIFFILFLILLGYNAFAEEGGIGVEPASSAQIATPPDSPYASSGFDRAVSFWELPLWVQVTFLSMVVVAILGSLKLIPLVWGRLRHALENPKTRQIFHFIQRNPGVCIVELSKEQKINRGTLKYHISQLLSNNKIILIRKGKFSRLFYNTSSPMDKESVVSHYLKNEKSSRMLFKIMDNPGISNQELSDGFGLAKSTTYEYLKNFFDDGLVEFRQDGKFKRYYLKQDARIIMLHYRPQ
jgi:predicted transcriptional regulator